MKKVPTKCVGAHRHRYSECHNVLCTNTGDIGYLKFRNRDISALHYQFYIHLFDLLEISPAGVLKVLNMSMTFQVRLCNSSRVIASVNFMGYLHDNSAYGYVIQSR